MTVVVVVVVVVAAASGGGVDVVFDLLVVSDGHSRELKRFAVEMKTSAIRTERHTQP